jgi:hypothetical protein
MKYTSVTVALFGAQTWQREWVLHELKRSHELKKGILAIDIHNIKDPQAGTDVQGDNPLAYCTVRHNGNVVALSRLHKTYDWVRDDGYNNMPNWIEAAAGAAGR